MPQYADVFISPIKDNPTAQVLTVTPMTNEGFVIDSI